MASANEGADGSGGELQGGIPNHLPDPPVP